MPAVPTNADILYVTVNGARANVTMLLASGANNNRYWEGEFAAFWVFGDDISSADLQDLKDNTRGYLGV